MCKISEFSVNVDRCLQISRPHDPLASINRGRNGIQAKGSPATKLLHICGKGNGTTGRTVTYKRKHAAVNSFPARRFKVGGRFALPSSGLKDRARDHPVRRRGRPCPGDLGNIYLARRAATESGASKEIGVRSTGATYAT